VNSEKIKVWPLENFYLFTIHFYLHKNGAAFANPVWILLKNPEHLIAY